MFRLCLTPQGCPRERLSAVRAMSSACVVSAGLFLVAYLVFASPAGADWLVTGDDEVIETRGPWQVKGGTVVYTGTNGVLSSMRLGGVNLSASEEMTRQGGPARETTAREPEPPREAAVVITNDDVSRFAGVNGPPKIVMYSTSWCSVCKRARAMLTDLDADFVEKDIERDPVAALEFRARSPREGGVPLLDYGGSLSRGLRRAWVLQAVNHQREWRERAEQEAARRAHGGG